MSNALAILRPQNMAELEVFASRAASSSLVPQAYRGKPDDILVAVQMGSELGLPPMQSLQNISVINGRPAVWGDAMPGLVYGSGKCQHIKEKIEGEGDNIVATCSAKRMGTDYEVTVTFSVADAKKAGLWNKAGPWQQYPKRMLQLRARGFALRDAFPDVLRGLISAEEARDIPPDDFKGQTIEARAEPVSTGTIINDEIPARVMDAPRKRTVREIVRDHLVGCQNTDDVAAIAEMPIVAKALKEAPQNIREELTAMLGEAYAKFAEEAELGAANEPEPVE